MMINPNTYLLIPSVPTPNGRLHLGHIGGPYLSADILARHLRTQGHTALIIMGTDSYESYVIAEAEKLGCTPEAICHHYHSLIADDLQAMDIQVDEWVNPLEKKWHSSYHDWHKNIFNQLTGNNVTQKITEFMPWDEYSQSYLTGCKLVGHCPICQKNIRGYFCESCGAHFRPEEAIKLMDYKKEVSNIFLHLPVNYYIKNKGLNSDIQLIFSNYLQQQKYLLRLTTQSDWGLNYDSDSVLFNYGLMFSYFLMFGEIAGKILQTNKNAFAVDSPVITISSFGIDNAVPFLSSTLGISSVCKKYKPFDYYLVNYFYHLDGQKFSTSRRHAIWVNDIIKEKNYCSDIVRLYLASIDVRNSHGNFISADFIKFYNKTIVWINKYVLSALARLPVHAAPCEDKLIININNYLSLQLNELQPNHFFPHKVIHSLKNWFQLAQEINITSPNYFWWLKAFSVFIYPIMPKLGKAIWQALGANNEIRIVNIFIQPTLPLQRNLDFTVIPIS